MNDFTQYEYYYIFIKKIDSILRGAIFFYFCKKKSDKQKWKDTRINL
jgi:hypothetical protein